MKINFAFQAFSNDKSIDKTVGFFKF